MDLGDALAGLHQLIEHLEGKTDFAGCLRDMDRLMLDTLRQMDGRVANNRTASPASPTGCATSTGSLPAGSGAICTS